MSYFLAALAIITFGMFIDLYIAVRAIRASLATLTQATVRDIQRRSTEHR